MSRLTWQGGALFSAIVCALIAGVQPAVAQSSLQSGWTDTDIGSPVVAGSATSSGSTITVVGAGTDIGGTADEFHFAYLPSSGDLDVRVQIASLQNVDPAAKAGIMIRESLQDDARHAFMFVSPGNGLGFARRVKPGRMTAQTSGLTGASPVWVRLVRRGKTFSAYSSDTGATWTLVGTAMINMNSSVYVGLALTSHVPSKTATADFASLDLGSAAAPLPAPWNAADIGNPASPGKATASGNTFTVTGGGVDIGGTSDQFQFVYQPMTGDTQLVAWLGNLQAVDSSAKAGVMIREALTGPAAHASVFVTGSSGFVFDRRTAAGGVSSETNGSTGNASGWLKIVREGNLFSALESQDGSQWTLIGADTILMPATAYVGLAVSSHNTSVTATGTFSNVAASTPATANKAPTVSISAPTTGASYTSPANIAINTTAADSDGSIVKVDFYAGSQLLGSDTTTPYSVTWSSVAAGTYNLTAVATDNAGATTTSQPVTITVAAPANKPPTVSISAPAAGASYTAPASMSITATAADPDGSVTRVDFYAGTQPVGSDTSTPFSVSWSGVAAGNYSLTAVATDNTGAKTTSAAVTVTVAPPPNKPPTVSMSTPAAGTTYTAPASMSVSATASDPDGSVVRVDFYAGTQVVGSDTSSPFSMTWSGVAAGTYNLTAVATDNAGAKTTSSTVSITVAVPLGTTVLLTPPVDYATNVTSLNIEIRRSVDAVTASPVASKNVGKPAVIMSDVAADISSIVDPLPTGSYYAVVISIGPYGSTKSAPSAVFSK